MASYCFIQYDKDMVLDATFPLSLGISKNRRRQHSNLIFTMICSTLRMPFVPTLHARRPFVHVCTSMGPGACAVKRIAWDYGALTHDYIMLL